MKIEDLTEREKVLINLVHFLAHGTKHEVGFGLRKTLNFLETRSAQHENKTVLALVSEFGDEFLNELKTYINGQESRTIKKT